MSQIYIITAMDKNGLIGNKNKLPWNLPRDLKYFQDKTIGNVCLMGYNTWESLPHRPLKNRVNIILTSKKITENYENTIFTNNLDILDDYNDWIIFVIGGRTLYKQFLNKADKLFITRVEGDYSGDTYFPTIDYTQFELVSEDVCDNLTFEVWERM